MAETPTPPAEPGEPQTFACRQCARPVTLTTEECPGCGNKAPFACSQCRRGISAHSLKIAKSKRYPFGSLTQDGRPLCSTHRLTRCHKCEKLLTRGDSQRKIVSWREDRQGRHGMRPRLEEVQSRFCPECAAEHVEPVRPPEKRSLAPVYFLVLVVLMLGLYVWITHRSP